MDRFEEPISRELVEELRQMVRFCEKRNRGGGGKCTRGEFVRLKSCGELDQRLEKLGIISVVSSMYRITHKQIYAKVCKNKSECNSC